MLAVAPRPRVRGSVWRKERATCVLFAGAFIGTVVERNAKKITSPSVRERDGRKRAGGSTRASEPEGSAYTSFPSAPTTARAFPRVWARPRWRLISASSTTASRTSRTTASTSRGDDNSSPPRERGTHPSFASRPRHSTAGGTPGGVGGRLDRRDVGPTPTAVLRRVGSTSYRADGRTCNHEPRTRGGAARVTRGRPRDFRHGVRAPQRRAGRGSGARDQRWGSCSPAPRRGGRGERREVQRAERCGCATGELETVLETRGDGGQTTARRCRGS